MTNRCRFRLGVRAFFLVGVAVGLLVALPLLDRGKSPLFAIGYGAAIGGYGAWFVFFCIFRVRHWIYRPRGTDAPELVNGA
jgi:hypothetical protein